MNRWVRFGPFTYFTERSELGDRKIVFPDAKLREFRLARETMRREIRDMLQYPVMLTYQKLEWTIAKDMGEDVIAISYTVRGKMK